MRGIVIFPMVRYQYLPKRIHNPVFFYSRIRILSVCQPFHIDTSVIYPFLSVFIRFPPIIFCVAVKKCRATSKLTPDVFIAYDCSQSNFSHHLIKPGFIVLYVLTFLYEVLFHSHVICTIHIHPS